LLPQVPILYLHQRGELILIFPTVISELGSNRRWKDSLLLKDLGPAKQILGMKVIRDHSKKLIWLSQEKYIEKALKRFNMDKAKPVSVPLAKHFKLSTM